MNEANRTIRRIKRGGLIFSFSLIIGIIAASLLPLPVYAKVVALPIIAFFALGIRGNYLIRRVNRIVEEELDPIRYHYVMHGARLASDNAFTDIATACATGDYSSAIGLCRCKLEGCRGAGRRIPYLLYLAACFYDLEDLENLSRVCTELGGFLQDPKKGKRYEKAYGEVLRYYIAYLKGDFTECKTHRERWNARTEKEKTRFARYRTEYLHGMACLKNGEAGEAAESFRIVARECPLLYIGKLSADRLCALDGDTAYRVQSVPSGMLFPVIMPEQAPNKRGGLKLIIFLVAVALLTASVGTLFSRSRGTAEEVLKYQEGLTELYAIVPVNEEGDALCVYAGEVDFYISSEDWEGHTEPAMLCVAYLNKVGEDTYRYGICVDVHTISPHVIYEICAGDSNLRMSFIVVENLTDIPEEARVTELVHNGKAYYFCLTEVAQEKCVGYREIYTNKTPNFENVP